MRYKLDNTKPPDGLVIEDVTNALKSYSETWAKRNNKRAKQSIAAAKKAKKEAAAIQAKLTVAEAEARTTSSNAERKKVNAKISSLKGQLAAKKKEAAKHDKRSKSYGSGKLPTKTYSSRPGAKNAIYRIICHQHGSHTETTSDMETFTEKIGGVIKKLFIPKKLTKGARIAIKGRKFRGFPYHYDLPHFEDKVYHTQEDQNLISHAGGENSSSVGVSLIGLKRHRSEPFGKVTWRKPKKVRRFLEPKAPASENFGLPSEYQAKNMKLLVQYLQEKYLIQDCHVEGHFQNSNAKRKCPGWDIERWILKDKQESERARTFCYPIRVKDARTRPVPGLAARAEGGDVKWRAAVDDAIKEMKKAPLLDGDGLDPGASAYFENTRDGGHGFFPFGRRPFWHGGVHLFPEKEGETVFCVRHGWVVAAQVKGEVKFEEEITKGAQKQTVQRDFGSICFVLLQHRDPGFPQRGMPGTEYSWKEVKARVRPLRYYSLYMHLMPQNENKMPPWLWELKYRSKKTYDAIVKDDKPLVFHRLSIPVETGEPIGFTASHNPFAMRRDKVTSKVPMLHFEIFSEEPLVEYFNPERKHHGRWTVTDRDRNPFAGAAKSGTLKVKGLGGQLTKTIADWEKKAKNLDKRAEKIEHAPHVDDEVHDRLSCVISLHKSEWEMAWVNAARKWMNHHGYVADQAKLYDQNYVTPIRWLAKVRTAQLFSQIDSAIKRTGSRRTAKREYYHYHPIRILNWLHALRRVPKKPSVLHGLNDYSRNINPFPVTVPIAAKSNRVDTLVIGPYVDASKKNYLALPDFALRDATVTVLKAKDAKNRKKTAKISTLDDFSKTDPKTLHRTVTLSSGLPARLEKGDRVQICHGDRADIGWKWKAGMAWDEKIL